MAGFTRGIGLKTTFQDFLLVTQENILKRLRHQLQRLHNNQLRGPGSPAERRQGQAAEQQ
jgi:hypothetical protein